MPRNNNHGIIIKQTAYLLIFVLALLSIPIEARRNKGLEVRPVLTSKNHRSRRYDRDYDCNQLLDDDASTSIMNHLQRSTQERLSSSHILRGGDAPVSSISTDGKDSLNIHKNENLSTRLLDVIKTYWYLGFIGFGGPPAHVGLLRDILVQQKRWFSDDEFTDMFSLTQALPGPSSTQLLVATAASRAGVLGGIIACVLWCLPGFLVMSGAGIMMNKYNNNNVNLKPGDDSTPLFFQGIPAAALALTLSAGYRFVASLDGLQKILATISCLVALLINNDNTIPKTSAHFVYPILLTLGGIVSYYASTMDMKDKQTVLQQQTAVSPLPSDDSSQKKKISQTSAAFNLPAWFGVAALLVCAGIFGLTMIWDNSNPILKTFQVHYRAGGIVFGGGPVIVPLLAAEAIPDWMTSETFFQGVGLAQSLPGPMFNFVGYLGAIHRSGGWKGAIAAELGMFGPGFILIFAVLPFWSQLRDGRFKPVLRGVNGAAIGLIGSACVMIYASSVRKGADAMVLAGAGSLVAFSSLPAPFVILVGAIFGAILKQLDLAQKAIL